MENKDNKFLDPCVVAAQPITQGSTSQPQKPTIQHFSLQPSTVQQEQPKALSGQLSPTLQPRAVQNLYPIVSSPAVQTPTLAAQPQSSLSLEIAQQQLQQQQQLARILQLHRQQPQVMAQPAFIPALQQMQLQQLLQHQQQANLLQSQHLLLQQQTQQLAQQRQQQLLLHGQQLPAALTPQQLLMYDQQQLAQLHPHQLQQLHQQLQQQIQLQLQQQHHLSDATSPQKLPAQNGLPVERGIFGFPPGVSGLPQQLGVSLQTNVGAATAAPSPATPAADGAVSAFLPMGTGFITNAPQALEHPRQERQQRPRRNLMDQQSRQQEQQHLQLYATQQSSFERPAEVEKSPLPVRRPTKALEIVDPKTNQVIQLTQLLSTSAEGKHESTESPTQANSISKAIPIIDPKTNEPIAEPVKPEADAIAVMEATVNTPYLATESPDIKQHEKPELAPPEQENLG
eukprot:GGOE01004971.1.p1 GENE.GGOE01004971.1~~GGOE01004971.1.p1  ORF type:complete len:513 (-),score=83.49 GGOE01004971.1:886-2253(-)